MQIARKSYFKNPAKDLIWFEKWVSALEMHNGRTYERIEVATSLGKTHVWGLNTADTARESLVVFPGARSSALFWDFDKGLDRLGRNLRVFLVETNGLPNPSTGNTPDIRSAGFGHWASELLDRLNLQHAYIAGASFGGLVALKLCITAPEKVKAVFLLNPGCLQPFSLSAKNLFYNLLPIIFPTRKNIARFLDTAVFCKPVHQLSHTGERLIIEYERFALRRYCDRTQKPYYMREELEQVRADVYLLLGDQDLLFPNAVSIEHARARIKTLQAITTFDNVGHGIETYSKAIEKIEKTIAFLEKKPVESACL